MGVANENYILTVMTIDSILEMTVVCVFAVVNLIILFKWNTNRRRLKETDKSSN